MLLHWYVDNKLNWGITAVFVMETVRGDEHLYIYNIVTLYIYIYIYIYITLFNSHTSPCACMHVMHVCITTQLALYLYT